MATFEEEYKKYSTSGNGKAVNDLNYGQQQKLIKNETVKTLFDRYGVKY